jgi:UDP-galactopyranose mutase
MVPFELRVRTTIGSRVYPLPVSLTTINQFFGTALSPDEARAFLAEEADDSIDEPSNFEEQALKLVGRRLYEAFFYGYTRKQWGLEPRELPAKLFSRLPVRFDDDDRYSDDVHQAVPRHGYTRMVEAILDHPSVDVFLDMPFDPLRRDEFDHVVWTGPLDGWFGHSLGRLGYRTLDFEVIRADGDHQSCPVMNYGDLEVAYTRVTEHKYFAPWEHHAQTVCFREHSRLAGPDDVPYYPIRLARDHELLARYVRAARREERVTFVGRLGTYRYLDMDDAIGEALLAADVIVDAVRSGRPIPSLVVDPA